MAVIKMILIDRHTLMRQGLKELFELDDNFKESFYKELEIVKHDINLNYLVYLWHYIFFLSDNNYVIKWPNKLSNFSDHGSFMMPVVSLLMGFQKHKEVMKLKTLLQEKRSLVLSLL